VNPVRAVSLWNIGQSVIQQALDNLLLVFCKFESLSSYQRSALFLNTFPQDPLTEAGQRPCATAVKRHACILKGKYFLPMPFRETRFLRPYKGPAR
jgi:hypothetical protein